jgi:hypothetical protein
MHSSLYKIINSVTITGRNTPRVLAMVCKTQNFGFMEFLNRLEI